MKIGLNHSFYKILSIFITSSGVAFGMSICMQLINHGPADFFDIWPRNLAISVFISFPIAFIMVNMVEVIMKKFFFVK